MPKPVLSDSLFNANDVATAILDSAELSVTNQDFAVTDRTSLFVKHATNINTFENPKAFSFNGFMFIQGYLVKIGGPPTSMADLVTISDSNFYPTYEVVLPTASYEGDTAGRIIITTNGEIRANSPTSAGDSNWRGVINGWYRFS